MVEIRYPASAISQALVGKYLLAPILSNASKHIRKLSPVTKTCRDMTIFKTYSMNLVLSDICPRASFIHIFRKSTAKIRLDKSWFSIPLKYETFFPAYVP